MALESSCWIWCLVILVVRQRFGESNKHSYSTYTNYRRPCRWLGLCWITPFDVYNSQIPLSISILVAYEHGMFRLVCCTQILPTHLPNYWLVLCPIAILCSCGTIWKLYKWYWCTSLSEHKLTVLVTKYLFQGCNSIVIASYQPGVHSQYYFTYPLTYTFNFGDPLKRDCTSWLIMTTLYLRSQNWEAIFIDLAQNPILVSIFHFIRKWERVCTNSAWWWCTWIFHSFLFEHQYLPSECHLQKCKCGWG